MSSMVLSGDTSGTVTVTVPAVAGTNTATIPAATGTVMVSGNMPAFSAYCSTNQSISTGVYTKIQINTKTGSNNIAYDTNGYFDAVTNYRFTPLIAGYYQINGGVYNGNNGSTFNHGISIYKNGSANNYIFGSYPTGGALNITNVIYLNGSTDYVELYYAQSSGTSQLVTGGYQYTWFSGTLIRTA